MKVTNTTNHVGFFKLQLRDEVHPRFDAPARCKSGIRGGNASTPKELAAGATGTLKATLSPTAPAGTKVHGVLSVIDSTDFGVPEPAVGFPESFSDFHDFPYAYTVG